MPLRELLAENIGCHKMNPYSDTQIAGGVIQNRDLVVSKPTLGLERAKPGIDSAACNNTWSTPKSRFGWSATDGT